MKERKDKRSHFGKQPGGPSGRSPSALSYEQLKSCADLYSREHGTLRTQTWDLHKNRYKDKETYVQTCGKILRPPNRTSQEKAVASRSDCNREDRDFIVKSGASLHTMSKNELSSGEEETITRSKETTVIATANGKAESTEETAVSVNDLNVFCHKVAVGSFTRKVLRCKFEENHVPIVAVSQEHRFPDVSSRPSGDRLHFQVFQALGDRSRKVPARPQLFTEGLSGEPSQPQTTSWWNNLLLSRREAP